MLIHCKEPVLDLRVMGQLAHCFGPFTSYEQAEAFDAEAPDDCYKIALPIAGPDLEDIIRGMHPETDDQSN